MREELVSWTLDTDDEYTKNLGYVRNIYKDKKMTKEILREEVEAVFDAK